MKFVVGHFQMLFLHFRNGNPERSEKIRTHSRMLQCLHFKLNTLN